MENSENYIINSPNSPQIIQTTENSQSRSNPNEERGSGQITGKNIRNIYNEGVKGGICHRDSGSPLTINISQLGALTAQSKLDLSDLDVEEAIRALLKEIAYSDGYKERYGEFKDDKGGEINLKAEVFRRTIAIKHGKDIKEMLGEEKKEGKPIAERNHEIWTKNNEAKEQSFTTPSKEGNPKGSPYAAKSWAMETENPNLGKRRSILPKCPLGKYSPRKVLNYPLT